MAGRSRPPLLCPRGLGGGAGDAASAKSKCVVESAECVGAWLARQVNAMRACGVAEVQTLVRESVASTARGRPWHMWRKYATPRAALRMRNNTSSRASFVRLVAGSHASGAWFRNGSSPLARPATACARLGAFARPCHHATSSRGRLGRPSLCHDPDHGDGPSQSPHASGLPPPQTTRRWTTGGACKRAPSTSWRASGARRRPGVDPRVGALLRSFLATLWRRMKTKLRSEMAIGACLVAGDVGASFAFPAMSSCTYHRRAALWQRTSRPGGRRGAALSQIRVAPLLS